MHMTRFLFLFLLFAGLGLAITESIQSSSRPPQSSSSGPASKTDNNPGSFQRSWKPRQVSTSQSGATMTVVSVSNTTNPRTFSTWTISTSRGGDLRIRSTYATKNMTNSSAEVVEKSSMMTRFSAIVEFVDLNGNNQFDNGEALQVYRLGLGTARASVFPTGPVVTGQGIDWVRSFVPAPTDDGVNTFSAKTSDGVFEVSVKYSSVPKNIGGAIVPPTAIKFDVGINLPARWYNDTTGKSRIALLASVQSVYGFASRPVDASVQTASITKSLAVGDNSMAWSDVILADGVNVNVLSSGAIPRTNVSDQLAATNVQAGNADVDRPGEGLSFVVFSFNATQPKALLWDPTVGVDPTIDSAPSDASTSSTPSATRSSASPVLATISAIALSIVSLTLWA
jgi:hypothetical protein